MKKLLLLITMTITFQVVSANDSLKLTDSSQVTFSKIYSDVKAGIEGLAASLKVGATHVYEVLIRQQLVSSITYLIIYVIGLWSTIYFCKVWHKNDEECETPLIIIPIILGVLTAFCFLFTIKSTVTGFINPEYGAILDIIEFVK